MKLLDEDNFIEGLSETFNNNIISKQDIKLLYKTALQNNRIKQFENIAFTAKYINGLKRVLMAGSGNPEVTNIDQIKNDLSDNYKKAAEEIAVLIGENTEDHIEQFRNKYLKLDGESFANFNKLIDDLEKVKIYLNDIKRK